MDLFQSVGQIPPALQLLLLVLQIWTIFWKGVALWRSARGDQKYWFVALIALLPLNDLGIIELVYLFKFAKKPLTIEEVKGWLNMAKNSVTKSSKPKKS